MAFRAKVTAMRSLLATLLIGLTVVPAAAQAPVDPAAGNLEPVDLELVLAVDASGSVDDAEYRLQMRGIAAALRAPDVAAAIASGPDGSIAVTVMLWAEANRPKQALPWARLSGKASIEAFAAQVDEMPRKLPAGGTGIGKAIQYAVWQIERNGYSSARQVIDLSGDGRETAFREFSLTAPQGRSVAVLKDITVNGLAILNEVPDLDLYYRTEVIGGAGAFVEVARRYEDFAEAMRRKLRREIEWRPQVSRAVAPEPDTPLP
ncbi:DUF1194 domain-containing protein [Algihabitans albus]|uniref:DUF1194 domain-containing protein n=1 Tax=Algihabitans albus TaxID=2164067 RepID=UPI000E5C876C|nr:DUF1194 domain-containing protein [Algihabitans albus]